jgi:hypothetical protein
MRKWRRWSARQSAAPDRHCESATRCLGMTARQNTPSRSRCAFRASSGLLVPPSPSEGAGNAGRPMRPIAACATIVVERTRVSQVTPGNTQHSPRNGLRLTSCSSRRSGFFVTVIPEKLASQELDASVEASEPHDFAVRLRCSRQQHCRRPPHPAPTSVTTAKRPSVWDGTAAI